jgi:hypothetical protein
MIPERKGVDPKTFSNKTVDTITPRTEEKLVNQLPTLDYFLMLSTTTANPKVTY